MVNIDLAGKVYLVTGSSRGLGACTAQRLSLAGAAVAINYLADPEGRNRCDAEAVAATIAAAGGKTRLYAANVAQAGEVEAMVKQVAADFGRLDGLVNNAGIIRDRTARKMSPEEWQGVLDVNLSGPFYCAKYASDVMADGGRIVNLSSISGVTGFFGQANYAASKSGVIGLTKVLSRELAKRRITVNAVAPGVVETDMGRAIPEEVRKGMLTQIPLGRFGEPEDIANTILFLCSDLAAYITGQVVHVSGGWYV
jgi:3-oxoacyl-[acyl-carrier protein] reductase